MGVTYYSEAIIFTTKPEKIRDLIGQIYNLEPNKNGYHTLKPDADCAASTLCNLKVEENTITFNSGAYGVFGLDEHWITCGQKLLFKYLFDRFDGSLVCHESIESCNDRDAYYSATWVKDRGEIDVDEDDLEFVCTHAVGKTLADDPDFWSYLVWSTHLEERLITPASKQLIEAAKIKGFRGWATKEELDEYYNTHESITVNTIWEIAEEYPELEDLASDAVAEAEKIMFEFNRMIAYSNDFPEELKDIVEQYNETIDVFNSYKHC